MALPTEARAAPKLPTTALAQNRQVRQGDYIVTYGPAGNIVARVYSPLPSSKPAPAPVSSIGSSAGTGATGSASVSSYQPLASNIAAQRGYPSASAAPAPSPYKPLPSNIAAQRGYPSAGSGGSGSGGSGTSAAGSGGSNMPGAFDDTTYGGNPVNPASGAGGALGGIPSSVNTNPNLTRFTGPYANTSEADRAALEANPLAHLGYAFNGVNASQNPIFASMMSPYIDAASNPYFPIMLNAGMSDIAGVGDVLSPDSRYNAITNLMRSAAAPGGGYLSTAAGLQALAQGLVDPGSPISRAFQTTIGGTGAEGIGAQFNLMNQMLDPFLSLGTASGARKIMDQLLFSLYNDYTLGMANGGFQDRKTGAVNTNFIDYALSQLGYPGAKLQASPAGR